MKTLSLILATSLISSLDAFAKAYFFARPELIHRSAVIAIISLEEPEEKDAGGSTDPFAEGDRSGSHRWIYSQQTKVTVEKVLKGELPKEFVLHGNESFICSNCHLSKGKFLAFLVKDGDLWVGANWQLSLRPIRDKEVEWFVSDEQRFPMMFQKLEDVLAQIQVTLNDPPNRKPAGQPAVGHQ